MEHMDRAEFALGLVRMVSLHDEATATHLRATAALARRIAMWMHLSAASVSKAELGGLLHDIGKIRVGREILCKTAELSSPEWAEMRLHAENGASVLLGLPIVADLAPVVRSHHERMDGTGYPDRLRGADIPLEARVVAVADAFHALTTDRPYRRAILPQAALRVLRTAAGPQFDLDVVEATLDILGHTRATRQTA